MRRLGVVIVAAAIGCTSIGACGGSGDEEAIPDTVADYVPPEGITVEEWRAQMSALCTALAEGDDPFAGRPAPDDPDEALALLEEFFPFLDAQVLAMANVPPPAGRVRDLEQLQADLAEMRATIAQGAAVTDAGDLDRVYAALVELNRQAVTLNTRLRDLGVPACTA